MDDLQQLVYRASSCLGGCEALARKIGADTWEVFQWIAGRNLPKGRQRTVLEQALRIFVTPARCRWRWLRGKKR